MRGKIVNIIFGFMNLIFGFFMLEYSRVIPRDKTLITIQENTVVGYINIAMYIIMIAIVLIDIVQSYNHRSDSAFNFGYFIGILSIIFIFIKSPIVSIFSIICGLIILYKSLKENLVELNSTTGISISIVIIVATLIEMFVTFRYQAIGTNIKNRENKDELAYKNDYFKYITELDITDAYINVKKDGKFGYINSRGEETDFKFIYDYASPFVEINMYDKKFYIALVCKDGSSYIVLKNGRPVMSYKSESSDDNYEAKIKELEDIYKNTLGQPGEMKYEIPEVVYDINKVPVYEEETEDYTYRYDYNDEYDLIVTESDMGFGNRYELAKKDNLNIRINLEATNLDYDENYLYLYSNGSIPYYENDGSSGQYQGWFTSYGMKKPMRGKAQILDFFNDRILIRDYNDYTIYFVDSKEIEAKRISEAFKDIFICNDGRYIVRGEDNYFKVIDNDFNKVFESEYSVINTRLLSEDLYLVLNSTDNIKFNDYNYAISMNWSILNHDGNVIQEGIEQVYDIYPKISKEKDKEEDNYLDFVENLKKLNTHFVGDKFYQEY